MTQINYNTKHFVLKTDRPFKYAFGQHVKVQLTGRGGKLLSRPYTPITGTDSQNELEFIIKIYDDGEVTPLIDKVLRSSPPFFRATFNLLLVGRGRPNQV